MKAKTVPSRWIPETSYRLSAAPHLSSSREARGLLEKLETSDLIDLTGNGKHGIFNGPRFARKWTEHSDYGTPLLSGSEILSIDQSDAPLILNSQVEKMPEMILQEGTTLITSYGTVGRTAYTRKDMAGKVGSDNVMKVIPDSTKIASGYLFAFLSSKFGVPLTTVGTTGGTIPFLPPERLFDLPVPRLGAEIEGEIHRLVEEAAELRATANVLIEEVKNQFDSLISDVQLDMPSPRVTGIKSSAIQKRFDAQFHDIVVQQIKDKIQESEHSTVGDWCSTIFLPGIFKRIHIESEEFGTPYYTGASLFWLEPQAKGLLSRQTSKFDEVFLEQGTILVQAFGQDGGLTGRSVWVGENLDKTTTTHMLVRLRANTQEDTAYLYGYLQSDAAYKQIACLTYGGSIPHFDEAGISTVLIPLFEKSVRKQIADKTLTAMQNRDKALALERQARTSLEQAIEQAAKTKH